MYATILMFAHEGMGDEMEEHIGQQPSCLVVSCEAHLCRGLARLTANAVMVFSVLGLIWAGIKARMKLGTLSRHVNNILHTVSIRHSRANVERAQNCQRNIISSKRSRRVERWVLEFHAGPKGNSQAKTWRMIGDWPASSSFFSAPSCLTGSHFWMSVSWRALGEQERS